MAVGFFFIARGEYRTGEYVTGRVGVSRYLCFPVENVVRESSFTDPPCVSLGHGYLEEVLQLVRLLPVQLLHDLTLGSMLSGHANA